MFDEKKVKEQLENCHFSRYVMYLDILAFIKKEFHSRKLKSPKIIEIGGSNRFLKQVFNTRAYEVAANYPRVDVQNLRQYESGRYDFVILDQILEHVADPRQALREVRRILKKGGWLINSTPFIIEIHNHPKDYWRFSPEAYRVMLTDFSRRRIKTWGNLEAAVFMLRYGWPSVKAARKLRVFNLKNEKRYPIVIWTYAQK